MLDPGASAVVACSGGPDSSALALLVATLRPDLTLTLAYVAHGLRTPADDAREAARVATLAPRIGAEHRTLSVTVVRTGDGIEADARRARHAALEDEADRRGAAFVLHGHHAEDQAETVLLRAARGTGVDGLAGMASVAGRRLRPLLDVRRADLHRAAEALSGITLSDATLDPMNGDASVARVRLRSDVLPALAAAAPDPVGALVRLAALARDESAVLDATVAELRTTLPVVTLASAALVPFAHLRALPDALARRVLRSMLPDGPARDAASVERLLRAPAGWRATLPGPVDAHVDRGWLLVRPVAVDTSGVWPLDVTVVHPPSGITVARDASGATASAVRGDLVATLPGGLAPGMLAERLAVRLRADGPLHVRSRRDGDRVRTAAGTRALGDVLADAGVPRGLRDLLPVVVIERPAASHAEQSVVWVPGIVVDATARIGASGARD